MRDELTITVGQRFETGLIATVRLSNGRTHSQHFTGAGTEATRALCAFCDEHEARVLTLCTPATIYRDLIGSRAYTKRSHTAHRNAAGEPDSWFFCAAARERRGNTGTQHACEDREGGSACLS